MTQPNDPVPAGPRRSPVVVALVWTLWVLEVVAFLYLIGCAALLQMSGFTGVGFPILGILGLVVALGLFLYAVRLSFEPSPGGYSRVLTGSALILLAGFLAFGTCALSLN